MGLVQMSKDAIVKGANLIDDISIGTVTQLKTIAGKTTEEVAESKFINKTQQKMAERIQNNEAGKMAQRNVKKSTKEIKRQAKKEGRKGNRYNKPINTSEEEIVERIEGEVVDNVMPGEFVNGGQLPDNSPQLPSTYIEPNFTMGGQATKARAEAKAIAKDKANAENISKWGVVGEFAQAHPLGTAAAVAGGAFGVGLMVGDDND